MGWESNGKRQKQARPLDGIREAEGRGNARPSRPEPAPAARATETRTRRDRDDCPAGYDPAIWHLAKLFQQCARADGIELVKGLPVIHSEIEGLVSLAGIRGRAYRQEVRGCRNRALRKDMAAKCWYHHPPGRPREQQAGSITWVQLVEVIIAEFWSRQWDGFALDAFRQHFAEYGRAALRHWEGLAFAQRVETKPRAIMRRDDPRGTMDDASKEG